MRLTSFTAVMTLCVPAFAGQVEVVSVEATKAGAGYRFDVTLRHGDEGWGHYADRWDVVDEAGTVLGTRVLAHPHVDEQPFTRSATVDVPTGTTRVYVVANDSVHGQTSERFPVVLPK